MHRFDPKVRVVAIAAFATATAVTLVAVRPPPAVAADDGTALVLTTAWIAALGAACWIAVTTTACWWALRGDRPALARRVARVAPHRVRTWVDAAIAASALSSALATTLVATPLAAQAAPVHAAPVHAGPTAATLVVVRDEPVVRAPAPRSPVPVRPKAAPIAPAPASTRTHVVRRGENLWAIARETLHDAGDPAPSPSSIVPYWRDVVDRNRSTLRSGDPSLIFPGEIVELPPVPPASRLP